MGSCEEDLHGCWTYTETISHDCVAPVKLKFIEHDSETSPPDRVYGEQARKVRVVQGGARLLSDQGVLEGAGRTWSHPFSRFRSKIDDLPDIIIRWDISPQPLLQPLHGRRVAAASCCYM